MFANDDLPSFCFCHDICEDEPNTEYKVHNVLLMSLSVIICLSATKIRGTQRVH